MVSPAEAVRIHSFWRRHVILFVSALQKRYADDLWQEYVNEL